MMFQFGWWTTGRDEAALELFRTVNNAVSDGVISGKISYLFCSRDEGESEPSDRLIAFARDCGVEVVTFSASRFSPELRKQDIEKWRTEYHRKVMERLDSYRHDIVVLAGYMWVVSAEVCERLNVINLHPAAPGGPAGTWQEVIWQLLEKKADTTGVMMHLVTPELDKGPPVTYCMFPIKGAEWDSLWEEFEREVAQSGLEAVKQSRGEVQPLFARIREEGVKRELPLIVQTIKAFSQGEISIKNGILCDSSGRALADPYDLTLAIERGL